MCIIVAKAKGASMCEREILRTCFTNNANGAGIMWNQERKVHIRKGFMDWESFNAFFKELSTQISLKDTGVVCHFRITTHGKTSPQNCHPFPISNRIRDLKKLSMTTDVGVMHNGIIPIKTIHNLSDTQTYILKRLYNIKKAHPRFLESKRIMSQIEGEISSKMAFLTSDGSLYTIGEFVEQKGVLYSNRSFEERLFYDLDWLKYDEFWDGASSKKDVQDEYIENLKIVANYQGIESSLIDDFLAQGFTLQEIEDFIYEF